MTDALTRFHESWLGMVQPVEGLVVSVPVLVDAGVSRPDDSQASLQQRLVALAPPGTTDDTGARDHRIADLSAFFAELLSLTPDLFDTGDALPAELSLYVPEGRQTIRPTHALRRLPSRVTPQAPQAPASPGASPEAPASPASPDATPASLAAAPYLALVWDLASPSVAGAHGVALDLDRPETHTGPWDYPPAAKLDRLLRHARVPIGILTNRDVVRLVYAPHGESSGHIAFRIDDMASVGGRPILDAFVGLLSATRIFGVAEEHALPALLAESRKRQANVTNELAEQVFDALQILLAGFESAAERDPAYAAIFRDALERENDHTYRGLLTVLLRLVFLLYAEDRGLLPVDHPLYEEHLSVLALFARLQEDRGAHPDAMSRRFGAWGRLVALFRTVYLGAAHGDFRMPARRGALFDPHVYPFLEGWGPAGSAPIVEPQARADVHVPPIDDDTIARVLDKLLVFEGQRLSYKTLDVEQIGSVYEALMGYHVERVEDASVCMAPNGVWLTARAAVSHPTKPACAKHLKEDIGLAKAAAEKLAARLHELGKDADDAAIVDVLMTHARGGRKRDPAAVLAAAGRLVLQPGKERRRTSSHYTPRSLTEPIVRRTLEPLLACMGDVDGSVGSPAPSAPPHGKPKSDLILELKICDPAMGSGAFLVEACRTLADHLVAAWTREGRLEQIAREAPNEDPLLHARRLVAQRCLYGVDKNEAAVELAKLSLWLVTLAKDLPFTFLDHALRHGDSLVGLDFDQIRHFHWKPKKQLELTHQILADALAESIAIRQHIHALADDSTTEAQREKERLARDAEDASDRARLVADVCVGAFFAETKDKPREKERVRRLDVIQRWNAGDESAEGELRAMQAEIRARLPVFHWMLEYPEVFYAERPDPLEGGTVNRAAFMDGFVGNPPFMGSPLISRAFGDEYREWLFTSNVGATGQADLVSHFFRRAGALLGAHGSIGLIATNTIAQGDTRATGLQALINRERLQIYAATRSMMWPGDAAVSVALVHLAKGRPAEVVRSRTLDGESASAINSRLRPSPELPDPTRLLSNADCSFQGHVLVGLGFTLAQDERDALIKKSARNASQIFPYLGGEEVNTSPTQMHHRHVICFGQMTLDEAETWPDLLGLLRQRVKPERDRVRRESHRKRWWRFGDYRSGLQDAIEQLERCLVTARVTKHLCFSFQPTNRILNEKLYVFPLPAYTAFAVLQSRIHEPWVWLLSSTMKQDLNYSATDCFETFPFPHPDPRTVIPELEQIGKDLYETRAAYMRETQQGLTQTYNLLKDPACRDAPILHLRHLHEQLDAAVLAAYATTTSDPTWLLPVPPYCPLTPTDHQSLTTFQDRLIDHLFLLNSQRAADEKRRGAGHA